jgi:hypothetical protein
LEEAKNTKFIEVRIWLLLTMPTLACSAVAGLTNPTPTLWVLVPTISPPTSPASAPPTTVVLPATAVIPPSSGAAAREVSLLKCQNNPGTGIVPPGTPVVLVWGWATDNQAKRDEYISNATYAVEIDGIAQNVGVAAKSLESSTTVFWKLPVGQLSPGAHQVKLTSILSRDFVESSGTTPAGRHTQATCALVIQK